ncbi:hypothetical protein HBH64_203350 [Parastagonospora nodorum]|nr:hypothetical protein HBI01_064470 [Parastagonospora nodorum]KAH4310542.1 hypothetical protein HBI02_092560 [Parastagonospora nodorum]KAH4333364.1 hypothetical protein HBI00_053800 [Parastagonospora nodorum]KAH4378072.1 hypothetical protein HBH94_090060 [Parastagonospora nodorum]KAH4453462.1 hypothetical protein HBH90_178990 [Parastagonospora nodorum]
MLAFQSPLVLPVLSACSLFTNTLARPNGIIAEDKGSPGPQYATSLTGGEGCDTDDLSHIHAGFQEMAAIFQAALPYEPIGQPAVEFFGLPDLVGNYTSMIETNLQRAANFGKLEESEGPANSDIHVRCDDPLGVCRFGNRREGSHAAYNIGNEPHIVFCEDYFRLDPLKKRVDKNAEDQTEKDKLMEYYTRATLWARMVMHFSEIGKAVVTRPVPGPPNSTTEWTVSMTEGAMNTSVLAGVMNERPDPNGPSDIQTLKYAYGVTRAKLLTVLSTKMPYDAANNAENYALYAQARYVMREKGFYPSIPIMDFPNEATVLTNENLQDGEKIRFAFFDMTDVVARPANMELEGDPIFFSSAPSRLDTTAIGIACTVFAMGFNLLLSYG